MICENCNQEHDGSYGSGRFCSSKCARGFSTKLKREEINKKVSNQLKGRLLTDDHKKNISENQNRYFSDDHREKISKARAGQSTYKLPTSILKLSGRTIAKIIKRLNLGCSSCGWDKAVGDIHHIVQRSKGGTDDHTNLTYLCPNCHRIAHEHKIEKFVTLKDYIGDRWIDYYYPEKAGILPR